MKRLPRERFAALRLPLISAGCATSEHTIGLARIAAVALCSSVAQAAEGPIVLNVQTAANYGTIQAAIDAPGTLNGHTLQMLVPTHMEGGGPSSSEAIRFTKSLTLRGTAGGTTLECLNDTGSAGSSRGWIRTSAGTNCTFLDITFDGSGRRVWQALRLRGEGTVEDCGFVDIEYEPSTSYQGTGIVAIGTNVTVRNCSFSGMGRIGVLFFGSGSSAGMVDGATYVGKGPGNHLDYAVEIGGGASAEVLGLTVSSCRGDVGNFISAGVICSTFYGAGSAVSIEKSVFTDNTAAIAVGGDTVDTSNVRATRNTIAGNAIGVVNVSPLNVVDARLNYWGSSHGPEDVCGTFENSNTSCAFAADCDGGSDGFNVLPFGLLGNSVEENVDYCPWLENPPTVVGTSSCFANPNSTGVPATLEAEGSDLVAANNFRLFAGNLPPNQFGYFLLSENSGFIANPGGSDGNFCLGITGLGRFNGQVRNSGPFGAFDLRVDLSSVPQSAGPPFTTMILAGETWYFQAWFRDAPPSSRNNFTNAIEVEFQ